jgi:hypothetical protein
VNSSTDEEFAQAFLHGTLPPAQFHHRDHLRLAWYITRRHDPEDATRLISTGIRAFAAKHGHAQKYHETLTQFWVRIVAHLVSRHLEITDFEAFLTTFPHLLEKDLPSHHWHRETMFSPAARARWVKPDILALPAM